MLVSARLANLEAAQLETVEEAAPVVEARIQALASKVAELSAVIEVVRNEYGAQALDERALEARVKSLEADLKRNQDAQKLQRLGSELGRAAVEHVCPTCHQSVSSELLPAVESVGMGLEENILFVKSQIELYESALGSARERLQDVAARVRGTERDLRDKQQQLRSLRQELVRPSSSLSRASIEEIVRLQAFLDRLRSVDDLAMSLADELKEIAVGWASATDDLRRLPSDELTVFDKQKVDELERAVRRHLDRYGFRSFQSAEILLSRDNFRPLVAAHERSGESIEKEINFEISASDAIRLKWAYYLSIMQLAERVGTNQPIVTNHSGILIFDEPGQQEIESTSLFAFMKDAGKTSRSDKQIIMSTSELLESVTSTLSSDANIISFQGFILQPVTIGND